MRDTVIASAFFLFVVLLMVGLRMEYGFPNGVIEVKSPDILLGLIPIAIWLISTRRIKLLEFGGFKIESAFAAASKSSISKDFTRLKISADPLRVGSKVTIGELPKIIDEKPEALLFELGNQRYEGVAILEYLKELRINVACFRYVLMRDSDQTFFGLAGADEILASYGRIDEKYEEMAGYLREKDRESLTKIPGFIGREAAIESGMSRKEALDRMQAFPFDEYPVIDAEQRFVGILRRSRLTSILLSAIMDRLDV